ncbi:non-ribosomal peptide synthetase, partial [Paenibacillus odorifer]|uniref:non-ribosomal peptide synthetase n=1 Tax=Paenibacillus odorifer TaxID=189426 RepID=UPI0020BECBE9
MLKDSGASVLLRHHGSETYAFQGCILDFEDTEIGDRLETNPAITVMPHHLAYVLYTSGTTGQPKGVMIEHRSAVNFLFGMTTRIAFVPTKSILFAATLSFDISVVETLLALTRGMRIIVATKDQQRDPQQLTELIKRHRIAMLQATPSRLHTLLAVGSDSWLESVSDIMVGGEALTEDLLNQLQSRSSAAIYNMYGPTETTVWSMLRDVTADKTVTIGSPNANMRFYVVDPNGQLQPIGVAGELCIAGDGVGRGYINQPELTTEKYVDNPFDPGTLMYRTGDLARWQPDGNLIYMGRMDHQVKIRGYRIECGEIEVCLKEHEYIRQAVVLSRNDEQGQAYLCAYLVCSMPLTASQIHAHLARYLPEYMIPSYFVELENIPLNNNGKVDRKALPAPDLNAGLEAYEAPRDALEAQLAELFAEVLGTGSFSIGDSFFERGGHSLKA